MRVDIVRRIEGEHCPTKPSMLCVSVVRRRQPGCGEPLHAQSDDAISIADTDASRFKLHAGESLWATARRLHGYKGMLAQ